MASPTKTDISPLIRPTTIADGFTQSELSMFGDCAQKWNWRYNNLLEAMGYFSFPLMVGSALHDFMEQWYATKGKRANVATLQFEEGVIATAEDLLKLEYWNHVLPAMMRAYAIYYKDDHTKWDIIQIEEEVSVDYRGFRLRGKIDLHHREADGEYIDDHKSTSTLSKDVVAGWDFRFQFMFYLWLKWVQNPKNKIKGYYINAIKKPELRVKKLETIPAFAQRVFDDMVQEPDKYFYRDKFPITRGALQHFQDKVVDPRLTVIAYAADPLSQRELAEAIITNKNTNECQKFTGAPCPYIHLCRHGFSNMRHLYELKDRKHMELEGE